MAAKNKGIADGKPGIIDTRTSLTPSEIGGESSTLSLLSPFFERGVH